MLYQQLLKATKLPIPEFLELVPVDYIASCGIWCQEAFEVDWGDGTFIPYAADTTTAVVPTGTITVKGRVTWFKATTNTYSGATILDGSLIETLNTSFLNLTNITSFSCNTDLARCVNFTGAWYGCSGLTSFPLIDTSGGISFYSTWAYCSSLASMPLIDTSAGTDFYGTWAGCSGLVCLSSVNTTNQTITSFMFSGCTSLVAPTAAEQTLIEGGYNYVNAGACP